jgi:predicted nucleotidyltransferase
LWKKRLDFTTGAVALGVTHLWIFGSTARGDRRPDSDVDVLYRGQLSEMGLSTLIGSISRACGLPQERIHALRFDALWSQTDEAFAANVARDCVQVFGRSRRQWSGGEC